MDGRGRGKRERRAGGVRAAAATAPPARGEHPMLALQRDIGNAAVAAMVEARRERATMVQRLAGNGALARLLDSDLEVTPEDSATEREAEGHEHSDAAAPSAPGPAGVAAPRRSPLAVDAGEPLDASTRSSLEPALGNLDAVRVHADEQYGAVSEALGAEAFTHGADVFAPRHVSPSTLRHEVAHAARHSATNGVHLKRVKKHLDFIRIKKKNTQIGRMLGAKVLNLFGGVSKKAASKAAEWENLDHYGHWWVELGGSAAGWTPIESYGWWPEKSVGYKETLKLGKRVEGRLNQDGGRLDPHHGDTAEEDYWPVMAVEDTASYEEVRDDVVGKVRQFAAEFKGSWNWRLAWGKNCHTFVDRLKAKLGLHHQSAKEWLRGGGVAAMPLKHTDPDVIAGMMTDPDTIYDLTLAEIQLLQPRHRRQVVEFYMGLDEPISWQELNDFLESRFGKGGAIFKHSDKPLPKPPEETPIQLPEQPKNDLPPPKSENPAKTLKLYSGSWQLLGTESDPGALEFVGSPMQGIVVLKWNHGGEGVAVQVGQGDWQRFLKAHEETKPTVVEPPKPLPPPTTAPQDPKMTIKLYEEGWKLAGTETDPTTLEVVGSPIPGMVLLKWTREGEAAAVLASQVDWRTFRKAHGLPV